MKIDANNPFTTGHVGQYTIQDDQVVGETCNLEYGSNNHSYIYHISDVNYNTVMYNLRTCCYEIYCDTSISRNWDMLTKIIEVFNLQTCRYDICLNTAKQEDK